MKVNMTIAMLWLATAAFAGALEAGRTDGPEGSEYGRGGYHPVFPEELRIEEPGPGLGLDIPDGSIVDNLLSASLQP